MPPEGVPLGALLDLSGKVALVTGAAQGFGFACARRLAEAGAAVVLADRRPDRLDSARESLAAAGRTVATAEGDVSVEADVDRLVGTAVDRFGRLDVLVNNAGVFSNFLLEHLEAVEFHRNGVSGRGFWNVLFGTTVDGQTRTFLAIVPSSPE